MREPVSIQRLLAWITILVILSVFIYLGALSVAFEKLGVSAPLVWIIIVCSIIGGSINLPLLRISVQEPDEIFQRRNIMPDRFSLFREPIVIAINVGGGLIPLLLSGYLIFQQGLPLLQTLGAIGLVTGVSYLFSFTIPGIGIGMPILVAPVSAAVIALMLNPAHAPALAYVSGTLGVLVGADLLRLNEIRRLPANFASIGGAGTFDGVFMTGVIAVLLT